MSYAKNLLLTITPHQIAWLFMAVADLREISNFPCWSPVLQRLRQGIGFHSTIAGLPQLQ